MGRRVIDGCHETILARLDHFCGIYGALSVDRWASRSPAFRVHELKLLLSPSAQFFNKIPKLDLYNGFESTSMRYETLVARFWLRVLGVPQSSCRRQSRDKRQELWGRE